MKKTPFILAASLLILGSTFGFQAMANQETIGTEVSISAQATGPTSKSIGSTSSSSTSSSSSSTDKRRFPEIFGKFSKSGLEQIIVMLEDQENYLGSRAISADQAETKAINVKNKIEKFKRDSLNSQKIVSYGHYTPFVVIESPTLEDLIELDQNPAVSGIYEDKKSKLALNTSVPTIDGDIAQTRGYGGEGKTVVIIDTGVDTSHPEFNNFAGKLVDEACYSDDITTTSCPNGQVIQTGAGAGVNCDISVTLECTHGTHVAGIAVGQSGVAPAANYATYNTASYGPGFVYISFSAQLNALDRVANYLVNQPGVDVAAVNMSLGGGSYAGYCDFDIRRPIIDQLRTLGVAVIAATGNDGTNGTISSPACISSSIAVGSTNNTNTVVSGFSNMSSVVDIVAPGQNITAAAVGGGNVTYDGTSMATPHVAGAWAVMSEKCDDNNTCDSNNVAQIKDIITTTGLPIVDNTISGLTFPALDLATSVDYDLISFDNADNTNPVYLRYNEGDTITVTYNVINSGTTTAYGVTTTLPSAPYMSSTIASSTQGNTTNVGDDLVWNLGNLTAGQTAGIEVTYTATTVETDQTSTLSISNLDFVNFNELTPDSSHFLEVTINEPPVVQDDSIELANGDPINIDILANDSDATEDIDFDSYLLVTEPANGTLSYDSTTGEVTYTPNDSENPADDSFVYQICDTQNSCRTATVTIIGADLNPDPEPEPEDPTNPTEPEEDPEEEEADPTPVANIGKLVRSGGEAIQDNFASITLLAVTMISLGGFYLYKTKNDTLVKALNLAYSSQAIKRAKSTSLKFLQTVKTKLNKKK